MKIQAWIRRLYRWHVRRSQPKDLANFFSEGGNDLLYQLDLENGEIVVDGGGYLGDWTKEILCRFHCQVVVVEPIPEFQNKLKKLFGKNPRVKILEAALGRANGSATFCVDANASSQFYKPRGGVKSLKCRVIDVAAFMQKYEDGIGCLKLNIEGGEYDVLERLAEAGVLQKIKNFLIQFHRGPPDWQCRRALLQEILAQTHEKIWEYPMVWEKWSIR